jgi:hypothetical protein
MSVAEDSMADPALHAMLAGIRYVHANGVSMAPHVANLMSNGPQDTLRGNEMDAGSLHRCQPSSGGLKSHDLVLDQDRKLIQFSRFPAFAPKAVTGSFGKYISLYCTGTTAELPVSGLCADAKYCTLA